MNSINLPVSVCKRISFEKHQGVSSLLSIDRQYKGCFLWRSEQIIARYNVISAKNPHNASRKVIICLCKTHDYLLKDVVVIPLKATFTCTMPYYYTCRNVIQTTSTQYFLTSLTVQIFYFVLQITEQKCPKGKHFVEKRLKSN